MGCHVLFSCIHTYTKLLFTIAICLNVGCTHTQTVLLHSTVHLSLCSYVYKTFCCSNRQFLSYTYTQHTCRYSDSFVLSCKPFRSHTYTKSVVDCLLSICVYVSVKTMCARPRDNLLRMRGRTALWSCHVISTFRGLRTHKNSKGSSRTLSGHGKKWNIHTQQPTLPLLHHHLNRLLQTIITLLWYLEWVAGKPHNSTH